MSQPSTGPGARQREYVLGPERVRATILTTGAETEGRHDLIDSVLPAGSMTPLHHGARPNLVNGKISLSGTSRDHEEVPVAVLRRPFSRAAVGAVGETEEVPLQGGRAFGLAGKAPVEGDDGAEGLLEKLDVCAGAGGPARRARGGPAASSSHHAAQFSPSSASGVSSAASASSNEVRAASHSPASS